MTGQVEDRGRLKGRTKLACTTQKRDPAMHTTTSLATTPHYTTLTNEMASMATSFHRN